MIDHLALEVRDYPRSKDFYVAALGAGGNYAEAGFHGAEGR